MVVGVRPIVIRGDRWAGGWPGVVGVWPGAVGV